MAREERDRRDVKRVPLQNAVSILINSLSRGI
jgi:hypothetical protein